MCARERGQNRKAQDPQSSSFAGSILEILRVTLLHLAWEIQYPGATATRSATLFVFHLYGLLNTARAPSPGYSGAPTAANTSECSLDDFSVHSSPKPLPLRSSPLHLCTCNVALHRACNMRKGVDDFIAVGHIHTTRRHCLSICAKNDELELMLLIASAASPSDTSPSPTSSAQLS